MALTEEEQSANCQYRLVFVYVGRARTGSAMHLQPLTLDNGGETSISELDDYHAQQEQVDECPDPERIGSGCEVGCLGVSIRADDRVHVT